VVQLGKLGRLNSGAAIDKVERAHWIIAQNKLHMFSLSNRLDLYEWEMGKRRMRLGGLGCVARDDERSIGNWFVLRHRRWHWRRCVCVCVRVYVNVCLVFFCLYFVIRHVCHT